MPGYVSRGSHACLAWGAWYCMICNNNRASFLLCPLVLHLPLDLHKHLDDSLHLNMPIQFIGNYCAMKPHYHVLQRCIDYHIYIYIYIHIHTYMYISFHRCHTMPCQALPICVKPCRSIASHDHNIPHHSRAFAITRVLHHASFSACRAIASHPCIDAFM